MKNFIHKTFQDRILWELQGKKREHAIYRFCHTIDRIVNDRYIVINSSKISCEECFEIIKNHSSSKTYYIMANEEYYAENLKLDGVEFKIEEIIDKFFYLYSGAVMIIDPHTVMLKAEQCYGPSDKYILYRKDIVY